MKKLGLLFLIISVAISCSRSSSDDEPDPVVIDKSANLLATGDSANDILSNTSFNKLLIEIGFVEDFRPTAAAMANFEDFLRERTFKQDIEIQYLALPSPGQESLDLQEVADLENENRTAYNDGQTLAIYIYFTDAPDVNDNPQGGSVTLGAVYRNTSMVIYESTIRLLANQSSQIALADVETATLNHEFGHLLGLVDLGSPPVNDHEDTSSQNHCNVEGCLMRGELQFGGGIMSMLENRVSKGLLTVPGVDHECILDLQANGGR